MAPFRYKAPSLSITLISFIVCFGMISEGFPISSPIPLNRQNDIVIVTELSPHQRNATWNLDNLSQYQTESVSRMDNGVQLAFDKDTYAGGDEFNLSGIEENAKPAIGVNSNGNYMVAWPGGNDLYAQIFNPDGTERGSETSVCATGWNPKILCDSKNDFFIGFMEWGSPYGDWIYARRYDSDGYPLAREYSFHGTNYAFNPAFALDSNDNVLVAWEANNNYQDMLFFQKFDINGIPFNNCSTIRISNESIESPVLVVNKNDWAILAWTEDNYSYPGTGLHSTYFLIFDSNGAQVGGLHEFKSTDSDNSYPSISTDSDGNFIIALSCSHLLPYPDNYSEIIIQKYYPNGTEFEDRFRPSRIENQSISSMTIDNDGKIVLAWSESDDYYSGAVYIQRFDENGTIIGAKTLVETHDGDGIVDWTGLGALPSGQLVTTWMQDWRFSSGTHVYVRQFQKGSYAIDGTLETPDFEVPDLVSWGNFSLNASYMNLARNSISSYYSINGGLNWSAVPANMNLSKVNTSTGKIRFRIELSTTDFRTSPILNSFSLNYTVNKAPVILSITPDNMTDAYRQQTIQFAVTAIDPENDSLTYDWAQIAGPDTYIYGNGTDSASVAPPELGFYQFKLTLWDGHAHSLPAFANITVINRPPSINIWGDGPPFKMFPYQLHCMVVDPDEDTFTWNWTVLRSPAGTVFNDTDPLNPSIESPTSGNCSIQLSAIDSLGASNNFTFEFAFVGHPPVSALAVNRTQARPGGYFGFTANASFDPDNDRLFYSFDFGDGNNSGWTEVSNASHQYSTPGHFSATVTVRDTDGNISAPTSVSITILPFNIPPTVTFTYSQGNLSVPFQFKGEAVDPDGTIVSLSWDFGDGTNATGANVQHQYKEGGNYTVRLTATDNDGASVTAEKAIKVDRPPTILSALPASPMNLKWGRHANFSVTAVDPDGDALNYLWSVDGQKVGGNNQTYDFSSTTSRTFNITVAVDDGQGEVIAHSWNVTVLPKTTGSNVVVGPVLPPILIVVLVLVVAAVIISIAIFRKWKRK